jgi:hypothetical protein
MTGPMKTRDEHDDDLEPEVNEGAEIETITYADDEDLEEDQPGSNVATAMIRGDEPATAGEVDPDESEGEGSDTI